MLKKRTFHDKIVNAYNEVRLGEVYMRKQLKKSMLLALTAVTMGQSVSQLILDTVTVYAETDHGAATKINKEALAFIAENADDDYTLEWTSDTPALALTEAQKTELKQFVSQEILGNRQWDDWEKTERIFQWIVNNVKYPSPTDTPAINPYDVFKRKVAVCGGFSNLYKALLNAADVPSVIVYGTIPSGSTVNGHQLDPAHQWNAVYADGEWFYSDSTWGGQYFNKTIEDLSKDHRLNAVQDVNYEENGIVYGFAEGGLSVADFDANAERVVIPDVSGGRPVVALETTARLDKTALKTLVLGKNLTRFEAAAFDTGKLEAIEVDAANPMYESRDGVLFEKGLKTIIHYPEHRTATTFTIPKETVNYDEKETFQNPSLKTLLVEEGNPKFSSYEGVLYNKDKTEVLTVPAAAEKVVIAGTARLNNHALSFKPAIKEVVIEEGITEIPENLFHATNNLRKVTLPKSVTTISNKAFSSLNLAAITIVGDTDSTIERFAKENNMNFVERSADVEKVDEDSEKKSENLDTTVDSSSVQDLDENGNVKPVQPEGNEEETSSDDLSKENEILEISSDVSSDMLSTDSITNVGDTMIEMTTSTVDTTLETSDETSSNIVDATVDTTTETITNTVDTTIDSSTEMSSTHSEEAVDSLSDTTLESTAETEGSLSMDSDRTDATVTLPLAPSVSDVKESVPVDEPQIVSVDSEASKQSIQGAEAENLSPLPHNQMKSTNVETIQQSRSQTLQSTASNKQLPEAGESMNFMTLLFASLAGVVGVNVIKKREEKDSFM